MSILKRLRALFSARYLAKRSLDVRYALLEACLIGLFSALAALLLKQGIGWLGSWRIQLANRYGHGFVLPLAGLGLGLLAGWIVEWFSPEAAGGGIPQVKAVLARFPIHLSLKVALVKTIGTILVLGAGLTLGRRGPTVHIGAALAAQLSRWLPTSPEHRRQMIAAGAAAGLAAGFNTPIAGVLFVIEELMRDVSGLTLETAILASFIGAVVSRRLVGMPDELGIPPAMLTASVSRSFSPPEIPFYILLGIVAGLLGALFNRGIIFSLSVNRRLRWGMPWRVGMAGLLSGAMIAALPPVFHDNTGLREYLMMSEGDWQITAIAFAVHFVLTLIAYGSGAPGGVFAPALVLGAALGFLVGNAQEALLGVGSPNTYALAGMGAFFTAVVRVPVTAIVIVFEMTTDFDLVLPLMIGSVVAYVVAESVSSGSLYEHLLEPSGIHLNDETPSNDLLTTLTAGDVMQTQVETLPSHLSLEEVMQAMTRSSHRGFPVVEEGKLVGMFTEEDLSKISERTGQILLKEVMVPRPITVRPTASLSEVLYLLNRYGINRLPVIEGRNLIGIITHSDIIRAEAKQISGESRTVAAPSYTVYETRSPAVGRGRILLPLANPKTAPALLQIATAIARAEHYELECLQVIEVPTQCFPSQTAVKTQTSRRLLHRVERLGREQKIPVHTQIRVAQDTAAAILETISQRQIDLLLMGWKGSTSTQGAIFGSVVDTLIAQAPCDLVLVKLGKQPPMYPDDLEESRWLIPIAGGPNAQRAIQLLPALTAPYPSQSPHITLCRVYAPQTDPDALTFEKAALSLKDTLHRPVAPMLVRSHSVADGVARVAKAEQSSLVMLGASREGLLQHALHGNIPNAIARSVDSTVILVRGALNSVAQ